MQAQCSGRGPSSTAFKGATPSTSVPDPAGRVPQDQPQDACLGIPNGGANY
jgi:hypothetical protein